MTKHFDKAAPTRSHQCIESKQERVAHDGRRQIRVGVRGAYRPAAVNAAEHRAAVGLERRGVLGADVRILHPVAARLALDLPAACILKISFAWVVGPTTASTHADAILTREARDALCILLHIIVRLT